ncbi:MAG TPA: XRE family transcriptional regulator [Chthoniobacterales bacterium]|nr:XRE family transcriptional regulator [Chthoniobacterales bacterium]
MEPMAVDHHDTDRRLAQRLHQLRMQRSWSLEELATKSGVSRATLSRIENNEVSPTASVLGKLCAAFELTMSRLLAYVESDLPALVPRNAQPVWIDPETGFRRQSVSPPSPDFECELLQCELPGGAQIDYPFPPRQGLEHHLYLESGALELSVDGSTHRLVEGDCLRYRLHGASSFRVLNRRPARYFLVIR